MDLRSGLPYQLVKSGLVYDYPKLMHDVTTDVVIIGGGISGALMAFHLVEAGINCVVVDSRSIGLGSSCASTSLLQYEIDTPLHELIQLVGYDKAVRAYKLCGESILKLGVIAKKIGLKDFHFKDSLYYAASEKDVDKLYLEFLARQKAGFDVMHLQQSDIQREFGFDAPTAILSKLGAQTNAYLMTHLLHQYSIKKGTQIFDRTDVEKVDDKGNHVILYTKNGFNITAKKVVYATGYEVSEMLDKDVVKLNSTFACISEQFSEEETYWDKNTLVWNTANPYLYIRTTDDRRLLIGGRDEKYNNADLRDKLIPKKTELLVQDFKELFPHINFIPEYSWAGTFGSTKDGLPYIGEHKKYPNGYFSLGFGGNGITFSLIGAEIIRDLYLGKAAPDARIFAFDR